MAGLLLGLRVSLLLGLACLTLSSGCATDAKNIPPPATFMQERSTIGIIWLYDSTRGNPAADFYPLGLEGSTWMPNPGWMSGAFMTRVRAGNLIARLRTQELSPLVKRFYLNVFREAFTLEGFNVKTVDSSYDLRRLRKIKADERLKIGDEKQRIAYYDLSLISKDLHVDYLLSLEIIKFGIARAYTPVITPLAGIVPTFSMASGMPHALTVLRCFLADASSKHVLFQQFSTTLEPPSHEWDEPPDYPALITALSRSFEKSLDEVFIGMMARAP
jgi:hypothetical protein